MQAGVF
jgi:hypothetical protein